MKRPYFLRLGRSLDLDFATLELHEDYVVIRTRPGHALDLRDARELMLLKIEYYGERRICAIHLNGHDSMTELAELPNFDRLCAEYNVAALVVIVSHPRKLREYASRKLLMRMTDYSLVPSLEAAIARVAEIIGEDGSGPEARQKN